jgi:hypothetical protein
LGLAQKAPIAQFDSLPSAPSRSGPNRAGPSLIKIELEATWKKYLIGSLIAIAAENYHVLREYLERTADEDTRLGLIEFCRLRQIPIVVAWVSALGEWDEMIQS